MNDRHKIRPFIDWLIDNNKAVEKALDLYDNMEEYLMGINSSKESLDFKKTEEIKEVIYYCEQGDPYCQSPNCLCNTVRPDLKEDKPYLKECPNCGASETEAIDCIQCKVGGYPV